MWRETRQRNEYWNTILGFLAEIYSALSDGHRGIRAIRFLNDNRTADNVIHRVDIENIIKQYKSPFAFANSTIGASLMEQILDPFVFLDEEWVKGTPRKMRNMERPLLIMIITDGAVSLPIGRCWST